MRFALNLFLAVFASATCVAPAVAQKPDSDPAEDMRSVLDGVYTEAQAERGKATFGQRCAVCHSTSEFSAPTFLRAWRGQPVRSLYTHIADRMPFDNPGSLEPGEYTDILTYLFALHSLPVGDAELPADAAAQKRITIEIEHDS